MKLTRKWKLRIVVGIGLLFIAYAFLDYLFKFNINQEVVNNVEMVLMLAAFALLFSRGDQANQSDSQQVDSEANSDSEVSQIDQTALDNDLVKNEDVETTNN